MNPKYKRVADRVRSLIEDGGEVAALERPSEYSGRYIEEQVPLYKWLVQVENLFSSVFGEKSAHYSQARKILDDHPHSAWEVNKIVGILTGALGDLEDGFLVNQEHLIAGVVLDSVIEQARFLLKSGFKDPAAVLCRVVVEDVLQRISVEEGLDPSRKASALNDALRNCERYTKPQWRMIQSWLDIGNLSAHGKFSDFTEDDVRQMVSDVERFVVQELGA
jgi:hypothetical protein